MPATNTLAYFAFPEWKKRFYDVDPKFVVKENDASFRKFIDRALTHCLDVIYPLVADVSAYKPLWKELI